MHAVSKTRTFSLLAAILTVITVACADAATAPEVQGERSVRDTTAIVQGDTTLCRSGWQTVGGRVVCNE
jgi:hypothetical protein